MPHTRPPSLYQNPLPSSSGLPLYILNAAAFPDAFEVDYDSLLPYVLARLPGEDDLLAGTEYEVVFFAGGQPEGVTGEKKQGPGMGWYLQAYHVLSRATRKRLQKLWIVHERSWVRVLIEVFGAIVSPKFKRKIAHINSLSGLAIHLPIEKILIPPSVYLHDRRIAQDIYVPYASGRRAFSANDPLPKNHRGEKRLPRVLRETTSFICRGHNLQTEGIFRIPSHSKTKGVLQEAYDRGQRFIVWKEQDAEFVEPGMEKQKLADINEADAYGVHLAASLIKTWYRELKTPMFPESSYESIRRAYASPDVEIDIHDLAWLFSPQSNDSPLPLANRLVASWHLLPLLSIVASFEAQNKMSSDNLAICFAPALVCGSDQMQDAKMTSTIRRVLTRAIEDWPEGLEAACEASHQKFFTALQPPPDTHDYEDPLHETQGSLDEHLDDAMSRIVLHDTEEIQRPVLPPRSSSLRNNDSRQPSPPALPKRKPAPAVPARNSASASVRLVTGTVSPELVQSPVEDVSLRTKQDSRDGAHSPAETAGYARSEKPGYDALRTTPVVIEPKGLGMTTSSSPSTPARSRTNSDAVKRKPVSSSSTLVPSLADIVVQSAQLRSVSGDSTKSNDDSLFVKPTWAASSRQASGSSISSLRKESPPLNVGKNGQSGQRVDSGNANAYLPKPRTPSPGLLQRMQSWEKEAAESNAQRPQGPGSRKQSVDDLKKLYEERASAVASLGTSLRRESSGSQTAS